MGKEDGVPIFRGGFRDSQLSGGEALRYYCSTIDSASAGRMPQFAGAISVGFMCGAFMITTVCSCRDPVSQSALWIGIHSSDETYRGNYGQGS